MRRDRGVALDEFPPELLGELRYFYVNNFTQSHKQLERYRREMPALEAPSEEARVQSG